MVKQGQEVVVKYALVDGMHFFTGGNALIKGLCAASTDLHVAFNEVSHQIVHLMKHNHGKTVKCNALISVSELEQWLRNAEEESNPNIRSIPRAEIIWSRNCDDIAA